MVHKILMISMMIIFFAIYGTVSLLAEDIDQIQKKMDRALDKEIQTQKKVQNWSQEKQELVNKIMNLKAELAWNKYQDQKYEKYIQQKKEVIEQLKRKEKEMKNLRRNLEPYLANVVKTLGEVVDQDLPFLLKERKERLKFLRSSLTDYNLSLSERLRRILEALQVEAGYGKSVDVVDRKLGLEDESVQARVLHLGRIKLFYLSLTGDQVGYWDQTTESWQTLSENYAKPIEKTIDIAEGRRAAELVDIPLKQVDQTTEDTKKEKE